MLTITRPLVGETSPKELWSAFLEAAEYDAASPVTWSLINIINTVKDSNQENSDAIGDGMADKAKEFIIRFGILGAPVLAEVDADGWALACGALLYHGYIHGLFHAIDFALDVCPESFYETLAKGYPNLEMSEIISKLANVVKATRQENGYVQWREAPEHLDLLKAQNPIYEVVYTIEQADGETVKQTNVVFGANRHVEEDNFLYLQWRTVAANILKDISARNASYDGADRNSDSK